MALCTVGAVFDDVRSLLSDTQVAGGEVFTNNYLLTGYASGGTVGSGSLFGEPYRTLFAKMIGGSKRVLPNVHVVLPANTTVLIPSAYNITDFSEPALIEERASGTTIAIASTSTTTPIVATTVAPHGLAIGTQVEGAIGGIAETAAPWGNWFVTVTGASTFALNGSASDGVAGTTGTFYAASVTPFTEVSPVDFAGQLDGTPQGVLGNYLWSNNRLQFRGASNATELRITYYASGTAPTNVNYTIQIDNCRDFLACATAAQAAMSKGWAARYDTLRNKAYGDPSHPQELSLIDLFWMGQVLAAQRGEGVRQRPFRDRRTKFGGYLLG